MSTIFSLPGKKGDALLQWPVAYQWSKQTGKRFKLWMDESLKPLKPLFEAQACCEGVEFKPGVQNYRMGGQPFDMGLSVEDHVEHEIYHLGMRSFPQEQITLQTLKWLPFQIDRHQLASEPSLFVDPLPANRVVLHGTFVCNSGTPSFWRFLNRTADDLDEMFDEVAYVGTSDERDRMHEIYSDRNWIDFEDDQSFLELARLIAGSRLVIGAGSCVVALAGALKVPSIRVHDPIGECPRMIWSSLGPQQWNETERELRSLWPEIKQQIMEGVPA